jgi:hypothetical protein
MGDFRLVTIPHDDHKPPLVQEVQLALKEFTRDQDDNICLTPSLANAEEVDYWFDKLTKRLQTLRVQAKAKVK